MEVPGVASGLDGGLPAEWSTLRSLTYLEVSNHGGLHGTLPREYSALTSLKDLRLFSNSLQVMMGRPACANVGQSVVQRCTRHPKGAA